MADKTTVYGITATRARDCCCSLVIFTSDQGKPVQKMTIKANNLAQWVFGSGQPTDHFNFHAAKYIRLIYNAPGFGTTFWDPDDFTLALGLVQEGLTSRQIAKKLHEEGVTGELPKEPSIPSMSANRKLRQYYGMQGYAKE